MSSSRRIQISRPLQYTTDRPSGDASIVGDVNVVVRPISSSARVRLICCRSRPRESRTASSASVVSASAAVVSCHGRASPARALPGVSDATVGGPVSAPANAAALEKRSAGSLARHLSTAASTCCGTVSRTMEMGRGRSLRTFATIACTVAPVNGASPVSIS